MKLESGLFAEVPHELVASRGLKPSVKVILIHCLVRYQAKKKDGEPWTFSLAGIAAETGLSERTVSRHAGALRKKGVLKFYGTMSDDEREYDVFTFSPEGLVALIRATGKKPVVVYRAANGLDAIAEMTMDKSADNLSDNLSDKTPPRREDRRSEEARREDDYNQGLATPSTGELPAAEGGVCVGMPSTTVAPSSSSTTIQGACGNSNDGGTNRTANGLVSVSPPIIQASASGSTNTGAPDNNAGHLGSSAKRAAGASAKCGGVRGALPNDVAEHAQWKLRQWKKNSPCTKQSFEIVERELWKELSEYKWNPRPRWCTPLQDVNAAFDKVVRKHAHYE